jgi:hypothetical protein
MRAAKIILGMLLSAGIGVIAALEILNATGGIK